ncbi:MAG TPA: hypothetical protein VGO90_01705 [Chthoniobacteraceae bacterium]|nr:hypothetical protein [Chthoniobacteraceae bacterium]
MESLSALVEDFEDRVTLINGYRSTEPALALAEPDAPPATLLPLASGPPVILP